jgi:hypothetical protein
MIEFGNFKTDSFAPLSSIDQYDLSISENYFGIVNCDSSYTLEKYSILLFEYMLVFFEKIKVNKNRYAQFCYIFERGVNTVTSVFTGLIEYTKNVDLAFHHGKKAFYFYIEFIEQISDSQNSFLQLTSRDAVMFVYKRTIFEVNKEMVKPSTANIGTILSLSKFCNICKTCSSYFIQNMDFHKPSQSIKINEFVLSLNAAMSEVKKMNLTRLELVLKEIRSINSTQISTDMFLNNFARIVQKTQV